ncbi:MAG TPA: hypothetical protein VMG12_36085 [Polyangiaceae bacterium]|nr:hypothetical protein [Polyangiaceae bacterium]
MFTGCCIGNTCWAGGALLFVAALSHCASPEPSTPAAGGEGAVSPAPPASSSATPAGDATDVGSPAGATGDGATPLEPAAPAPPSESQSSPEACDVLRTETLGFDELSTLGFLPNELLPFAVGAHAVPMEWVAGVYADNGTLLDDAPRATSDVRLVVELADDDATVSVLGDAARGTRCPDSIDVAVRVHLETADGELGEDADGTLWLRPGLAILDARIPVESIRGAFAFEPPSGAGLEPAALLVHTQFSRYGLSGELVQSYGTGAVASGKLGARWPTWSNCQGRGVTPLNDDRDGIVDSAFELVRGTKPLTYVGIDGVTAPAQLAIVPAPDSACYTPAGSISGPAYGAEAFDEVDAIGQVELSSTALSQPLRFPVELLGSLSRGSSDVLRAGLTFGIMPCGTSGYYTSDDFVANCGDWGVDISGYESAFLQMNESRFGEYEGYAIVAIRGLRAPGCVASPEGLACADGWSGDVDVDTLGEARFYFQ